MARQQLIHEPRTESTNLFADAWSIKIVLSLVEGRLRFSALQHTLHISSKTLAKRLKLLEAEGILTRTLYAQVPLRVEYELTEKGYEYKVLIEEIAKWEKKWSLNNELSLHRSMS